MAIERLEVLLVAGPDPGALRGKVTASLAPLARARNLRFLDLAEASGPQERARMVEEADLVLLLLNPSLTGWRRTVARVFERKATDATAILLINGSESPDRLVPIGADRDLEEAVPRGKPLDQRAARDRAAWREVENALSKAVVRLTATPLTGATIQRFGPFADLAVEFSPGLNVLIGGNATGKSWLLKTLYAVLRTSEIAGREGGERPEDVLRERLTRLYLPDDARIGRLVRRHVGSGTARVQVAQGAAEFGFSLTSRGKLSLERTPTDAVTRSVFLPSREALAMFDGFVSLYERREISFDETYYDLCVALATPQLRGRRGAVAAGILEGLEEILGGQIRLDGSRFVRVSPDGNLEAHLLSEGLRKIGTLDQLLANGVLMRGSVLFWDEPEANLNPRLVGKVAEILDQLGRLGIQMFVATHDYLLVQRLSMDAEYGRASTPRRFLSLYRDESGGVSAEAANTIVGLEHNDIQAEFAALYTREQQLAFAAIGGSS
jgi:energy-coupling factor transporter ATP-binding protein EcfA2